MRNMACKQPYVRSSIEIGDLKMMHKYSMKEQNNSMLNWEDKRASEFWPTVKGMAQFIICALVVGYVLREALRPWI